MDDIGKSEVGTKIEYEGTLNDLYENHLEKFIEYNIHDVRIVKKLDDKLDFIDVARGICHVGHVPYEDIQYDSRFLEGQILVYLKKLGVVAIVNLREPRWVQIGKNLEDLCSRPTTR